MTKTDLKPGPDLPKDPQIVLWPAVGLESLHVWPIKSFALCGDEQEINSSHTCNLSTVEFLEDYPVDGG